MDTDGEVNMDSNESENIGAKLESSTMNMDENDDEKSENQTEKPSKDNNLVTSSSITHDESEIKGEVKNEECSDVEDEEVKTSLNADKVDSMEIEDDNNIDKGENNELDIEDKVEYQNDKAENGEISEKKSRKRQHKKKNKPEELLKCIVCGRYGLTSEFCASGRFCSQRCVGAYASKCRAENLAAVAASVESIEPKKRKRQRKDVRKSKKLSFSSRVPDKNGRFSPDLDDPISPSLSNVSSSSEEIRHKKSKLSLTDDAYFFYNAVGKERPFELELYLSITGKKSVPQDVFKEENPDFQLFPSVASEFKLGMKLEAVDPRHPSCICAVSVVETQGARLRLHFDGWSESYDFWTNSDSHFLFPVNWCKNNKQKLQPPRAISQHEFDWEKYLAETKSVAAPEKLFKKVPETTHKFTTNMKLEAVDKKNPDLTCVASITNVIGEYFLVHFDEWDDTYDYWCKENCPYLHAVGWCAENGIRLTPPQDDQVDTFDWKEYLKQTNTIAVPEELLKKRSPTRFEVGQKLEVVDPRNPSLLRLATIVQLDNFQLKIHFDGWDEFYDYWFDSASNDLHPVGWGEKTSHPVEPPPSILEAQDTTLCPTPGCRGIGHVKGAKYTTHHSIFGCPYSPHNVSRGSPLVDRLASNSMVEEASISSRVYNCTVVRNGAEVDCSPDSTNKTDLIKQQKLLKGILGRPAKKSNDKNLFRNTKLSPKGFSKFDVKEKPSFQSQKKSSNSSHNHVSNTNNHVSSSSNHTPKNHNRLPLAKSNDEKNGKLETSEVNKWTVREVTEFIRAIGLVEHAMNFEEQQIDGQALLLLSQADMIHHMKIKLGPALKITNAVSKI
eukprot:gene11085-12253_t